MIQKDETLLDVDQNYHDTHCFLKLTEGKQFIQLMNVHIDGILKCIVVRSKLVTPFMKSNKTVARVP